MSAISHVICEQKKTVLIGLRTDTGEGENECTQLLLQRLLGHTEGLHVGNKSDCLLEYMPFFPLQAQFLESSVAT